MAPDCPEEVNVFKVPHSRMKELVHKYLDMVTSTNFSDVVHLRSLLENLCDTFLEFRAHERIENKYIMRKLKLKLRSLSITNTSVCNCHADNRLSEMLRLVRSGYNWTSKTERERVNYGLQLRTALEEFTQQFLPHMEEEEEVFQPLLMKYFTYEELKEIKVKVIQQHQAQYSCTGAERTDAEKCVEDALCIESSSDEEGEVCTPPAATWDHLPDETVLLIMSHLSPRDLARSAQVSRRFNNLAFDPSLWTRLNPVQWARGEWSFDASTAAAAAEESTRRQTSFIIDEDADVDESECPENEEGDEDEGERDTHRQAQREYQLLSGLVKHLLPRVGSSITWCSLAHSKGITNRLVRQVLLSCPRLHHFDLSFTPVSDEAFKGLSPGCCCKLGHLDLTGCVNVTDKALQRLATALSCDHRPVAPDCDDIESAVIQASNNSEMLPYSELKKWLICDSLLSDFCSELCETDKYVKVSTASVNHYSSSDINQLLTVIRKHFPAPQTLPCCQKVNIDNCERCKDVTGLTFLSLSGCYHLTDEGLRWLSEKKCATRLIHLDLSGCVSVQGAGLSALVGQCTQLDHANLYYCDNIIDDPYFKSASGCQNLQCASRYCCRYGD